MSTTYVGVEILVDGNLEKLKKNISHLTKLAFFRCENKFKLEFILTPEDLKKASLASQNIVFLLNFIYLVLTF